MSSKITTETSIIQDKVEVHSLFCLRAPPTIFTGIVRHIQKSQELHRSSRGGQGGGGKVTGEQTQRVWADSMREKTEGTIGQPWASYKVRTPRC